MLVKFFRNYVLPTAMMAGGIIGVGFLALPYIALQIGIGWMLLYFTIVTAAVTVIHVMFGQVALRTPDFKRFPGFVDYYFGKPAEVFMSLLMIIGTYGLLLVYIIVSVQFLAMCLMGNTWWVGSANWGNLFLSAKQTGVSAFVLAFGPILFSLWGAGIIPTVEEMVKIRKRLLKWVIIIGTLVPAVFYMAFIIIILAFMGEATPPSALVGFSIVLGLIFVGLAFIFQGKILFETFRYDLGFGAIAAFAATFVPPVALYALHSVQFIPVISWIGTFLLPLNAALIILMYLKIKR